MIQTIKTRFGEEQIEMINSSKFGPIPKTIYKYRPWYEFIEDKEILNIKSKKIITEQSIYIPSPEYFNDPFDCKIPIAYDLISKDLKVAKEFFENLVTNNFSNLSFAKRQQKVAELMKDRRKFDENYVDPFNKETEEILNKMMSVYCVTAIKHNTLMWSHYSNGHTGICVGFDSDKLFNHFGIGRNVEYKNEYPIISPINKDKGIETLELQFYSKSAHWDYEIEYRLMTINEPPRTITLEDKTIIKEIILGSLLDTNKKEEIIGLIKKHLPETRIYETKKHRTKFELVMTAI